MSSALGRARMNKEMNADGVADRFIGQQEMIPQTVIKSTTTCSVQVALLSVKCSVALSLSIMYFCILQSVVLAFDGRKVGARGQQQLCLWQGMLRATDPAAPSEIHWTGWVKIPCRDKRRYQQMLFEL
jgi:hypothetical protein